MDIFQTALLAGVAFNTLIVAGIVVLAIRSHVRQKQLAGFRQKQILEQGKALIAKDRLMKTKDVLLNEQRALLKEFRERE